jgi:Na+/proline symporter/signal transduction histidine kinase
MNRLLIAGISLAYLALLFGIAYWVEHKRKSGKSYINNGWVYALSLAVYCTGWTYYGSVGRATTHGVEFLTIYLGPTVMCALFMPVLFKIVRICKTQRINSIADFISTRYGKNFTLGVIVTLCCVIGIIPYIALQLKAISNSFYVITQSSPGETFHFWTDDTFYITLIVSVFIIFFGTRSVDASERHEGLVAAVAFESLVKMLAFVLVGIFVTYGAFHGFGSLFAAARTQQLQHFFVLEQAHAYSNWMAMILVSMMAMILLPRQFQVAVVENTNERHIKKAMWLFPLYLFVINIFVLPIAMGGSMLLGKNADADMYVLSLPMHFNSQALSILVYVGGLSAASSMVIVETIALATMVSNHLILPVLLSSANFRVRTKGSTTRQILISRRISIVVILLLAYLYDTFVGSFFSLVSIGLVSMAAVSQFAPALFGGMYWRGATRKGAITGIVAGFLVWIYTLILPSVINAGFLDPHILTEGPWGISWLKPQALFGMDNFDLLAHSVFWSLLINIGCYTVISIYTRPDPQELFQADLFIDSFNTAATTDRRRMWKGIAYMADIRALLASFIGQDRSEKLLASYVQRHKLQADREEADPRVVSFTEKILSGVIGSASARFMVSNITKEEEINLDAVINIVRESQQVLELNKELKKQSIELTRATELLQYANDQLMKMDGMKDEFLYTVTHELRTPLTSIRALSEIVYDNPDIEEEQRQYYLESIVKETQRLSHLITQVLNLERYESGRQKLHFSAVDISQLVREVVDSLEPIATEQDAAIRFTPPDSMYVLQCDRDLVRQVLYNLVTNALKYLPAENGLVNVVVRVEYEELKVWVEDNGKGIPAELHTLIFDKFFQAHNQTLQKPQGSGLGLAICKKIVELHEGRIWAENKDTPGIRFVFTLPYEW